MAGAWAGSPASIGGGRRLVEWGMFAALLALLVLVFLERSREVQGRAELAAVRTTLGALRTGAVLQHLEAARARQEPSVASAQRNPFVSGVATPQRYLGELGLRDLPPDDRSGWFYDPACDCVGYRPSDPRWLTRPEGSSAIVFRIRRDLGALRFEPLADYQWQGESLQ